MLRRSPSGRPRVGERGRVVFSTAARFAGERRLVDGEVDGLRSTRASAGTRSPARSTHDVARHELARRDRRLLAVAQHVRDGRGHLPQRFERPLGAVLLDEPEQHGEQHDDGDDDRLERVAEEAGDDRRAEQNQDQHVLELREERVPRRLRAQRLQFVRAVHSETLDRGGGGQPGGMRREPRKYRTRPTAYARRERCPMSARSFFAPSPHPPRAP